MDEFRKRAVEEDWGEDVGKRLQFDVANHVSIINESGSYDLPDAFCSYLNAYWDVLLKYVQVAINEMQACVPPDQRRRADKLKIKLLIFHDERIDNAHAAVDFNHCVVYIKDFSPAEKVDYWNTFLQFLRQLCVCFYADEYRHALNRGIPQKLWYLELNLVQPLFADMITEGHKKYNWTPNTPKPNKPDSRVVNAEKQKRFKRAKVETQ